MDPGLQHLPLPLRVENSWNDHFQMKYNNLWKNIVTSVEQQKSNEEKKMKIRQENSVLERFKSHLLSQLSEMWQFHGVYNSGKKTQKSNGKQKLDRGRNMFQFKLTGNLANKGKSKNSIYWDYIWRLDCCQWNILSNVPVWWQMNIWNKQTPIWRHH